MIDIYKTPPLAYRDGIPVFSHDNDYTDNYDVISSDHVTAIQETGKSNPWIPEDLWRQYELSTVELIQKYSKDNDTILDVGVGLGRLLSHFPNLNRYGMDISRHYLKIASAKGINCCYSLVEDIPYHEDLFDMVVCTDILEHVIDLNLACHRILSVLKPGHHFIIRIPYKEDLGKYLEKDYPYRYVHLRNFDEFSLIMLFERIFNCQIVDFSLAPGPPPEINVVVKKLANWDRSPMTSVKIAPCATVKDPAAIVPPTCKPAPAQKIKTLYLEINDIDPSVDWWKPLSYVIDWREAFLDYPGLDVELCNINNLAHYSQCLSNIGQYELIVVSHAATGDDMTRLLETQEYFAGRKGKLVVFIGNEYDILSDKIKFIKATGADHVCTQLPIKTAQWLYEDCLDSGLIALPHALNPKNYHPLHRNQRTVDIGFIGDIYFPWVGDVERSVLIEFFKLHGASVGLNCDIRTQRIALDQWNLFLNNCNGIIGAESGTYYLNGRGDLLRQAKEYMALHPETSFKQLHAIFFKGQTNPISGKAISSRHFEPIGTKTCQLLLEGDYNGILKAEEHYISIKKDYSNIAEAIERFKDTSYRNIITSRAYDYVMSCHTYRHRIATMLDSI